MEKKNDNILQFPGNAGKIDPAQMNPQMTIDVKNEEAERLMQVFSGEKTNGNLTALINHMLTRRVLVPGKLNESKQPVPLTLKDPEGHVIQPVFSSKERIPNEPKSELIMNVPFLSVIQVVLRNNAMATGEPVYGLAINPFGDGVMLRTELLNQIMENEVKKAEVVRKLQAGESVVTKDPDGHEIETRMGENGVLERSMKLSGRDYMLYERIKFDRTTLPKKMYESGAELVEKLTERREEYLDELFEFSYENQRMYPYLVDEFKVMPMNVSEELEIIRVSLPVRDFAPGVAEVAFIVWNKSFGAGRYFIVVESKEQGRRDVLEILGSGKIVDHGIAPEEGGELNWVMEKIAKKD